MDHDQGVRVLTYVRTLSIGAINMELYKYDWCLSKLVVDILNSHNQYSKYPLLALNLMHALDRLLKSEWIRWLDSQLYVHCQRRDTVSTIASDVVPRDTASSRGSLEAEFSVPWPRSRSRLLMSWPCPRSRLICLGLATSSRHQSQKSRLYSRNLGLLHLLK